MANFFYSVGYGLEKVHSGMITYLCDLWNEGKREPLGSFLEYLQVPLNNDGLLHAAREWQSIDLVIFNTEDNSSVVAIEMKVDSSEGSVKGKPQTIAYPRRLPENTHFLYVTLGVGEFHRPPQGAQEQRVRWIQLRDFQGALDTISTADCFIDGWKEAVTNEVDLQDRCSRGDKSRLGEYRGRTWNLYLLGHLKETLSSPLSGKDLDIDPFVHFIGKGPDTILHFGKSQSPAYLEINDNGWLNLKVDLKGLVPEDKKEQVQKARIYYQGLLKCYDPKLNESKLNPAHNSRTIMSFDIGLTKKNENLFYSSNNGHSPPEEYTVGRLTEILEKFYGSPPCEQIDIDPKEHPPYF